MKKGNSRRVGSLLGFCFLLIVIISSTKRPGITDQSSVQAAGTKPVVIHRSDDFSLNEESIANCRYGVVESSGENVPRIGAGWFLDFTQPDKYPAATNNAEWVEVFKVFQEKTDDGNYLPSYTTIVPLDEKLAAHLQAHPGSLWIIGNEVDRGPNPGEIEGGQGDMYPAIYAQAYHDVRAFIKKHDPAARTAISGLVQATPNRLQYLDKVWDAYLQRYDRPIPVDVWNMHVYVLPELEPDGLTPNGIANIALGTDPALGKRSSGGNPDLCADADVYCYAEHDDLTIFGEQVVAMRQWMKDHDQQQKPLIISEFSLLYPYLDEGDSCFLQDEYGGCFTPNRVSDFMTNAFNTLNNLQDPSLGYALDENRLVQQWLWFSMYHKGVGTVSNILEPDEQTLTQVGETFRESVHDEPVVVNFTAEKIPKIVVPVDRSGTATAPIQVTYRNNGNAAVEEPFTVTFYEDQARTMKIGSVIVSAAVRGCATNVYRAHVAWPNLAPGEHRFWVTVDSENVIDEGPPQQQDNLGSGLVVVHPESSYVPMLLR